MMRREEGDVVESPPAVDEIGSTAIDEALRHRGVLLIDFWADWCAPCHAMKPILDELAWDHRSILRVVQVDVSAFPDAGERFEVQSLPTLLLFANGTLASRVVGPRTKRQLDRAVREVAESLRQVATTAPAQRSPNPTHQRLRNDE